jgi:hypothetical protein
VGRRGIRIPLEECREFLVAIEGRHEGVDVIACMGSFKVQQTHVWAGGRRTVEEPIVAHIPGRECGPGWIIADDGFVIRQQLLRMNDTEVVVYNAGPLELSLRCLSILQKDRPLTVSSYCRQGAVPVLSNPR